MAKKAKKVEQEVFSPVNEIKSATIQHPRFTIEDHGEGVIRTGTMKFDLSWDDGTLNSVNVELDLLSCWVDPNNNNAIEAFAALTHRKRSGNDKLRAVISTIPTIRVTSEPGFVVTVHGNCLRYATKEEAGPYSSDNELYENTEYFQSKHAAVTRVLGQLEKYNAIGGFESANLNVVSDELLETVGFFKVEESISNGLLKSSTQYWGANVSQLFESKSGSSFSTYTSKQREVTKMAVLFADKLRKEIEGGGK